jgi:hypothetical protein
LLHRAREQVQKAGYQVVEGETSGQKTNWSALQRKNGRRS